jgi:alpha-L-rhamnosidase
VIVSDKCEMMNRIVTLLISASLVIASELTVFSQRDQGITATILRCEYLLNPLSIDAREPRLSWQLESIGRGVSQTAYQIVVSSTPTNLAANKGDLWDTGRVASNQTIQIEYKGKPLQSRQQCFWKVRIWDQTGKQSSWSKPAQWTMGLLEPGDWSAKWIGDKLPSVENVSATMLRREFNLAGRPMRAVVYASALGVYELYINGRRVGDQLLAPEFTDYHSRTQYQAYDVTNLLKPGSNAIGALLGDGWYAGGLGLARSVAKKPRNIYGDHPRLLAPTRDRAPGRKDRAHSDRWILANES